MLLFQPNELVTETKQYIPPGQCIPSYIYTHNQFLTALSDSALEPNRLQLTCYEITRIALPNRLQLTCS